MIRCNTRGRERTGDRTMGGRHARDLDKQGEVNVKNRALKPHDACFGVPGGNTGLRGGRRKKIGDKR